MTLNQNSDQSQSINEVLRAQLEEAKELFEMRDECSDPSRPEYTWLKITEELLRTSENAFRTHINVVFDGPPAPEAGRFIEVEDDSGKSITQANGLNDLMELGLCVFECGKNGDRSMARGDIKPLGQLGRGDRFIFDGIRHHLKNEAAPGVIKAKKALLENIPGANPDNYRLCERDTDGALLVLDCQTIVGDIMPYWCGDCWYAKKRTE